MHCEMQQIMHPVGQKRGIHGDCLILLLFLSMQCEDSILQCVGMLRLQLEVIFIPLHMLLIGRVGMTVCRSDIIEYMPRQCF